MSHLRNLISDLVERRLWPVALLLAVALAAVPVVLGRGGDDATAPTAALPAAPATGADDATAQKAKVTVETSVPVDRKRPGKERNPFLAPASASTKTPETNTHTDQPGVTPNASSGGGSASGSGGASGSGSASASGGASSGASTGSTGSGSTTITQPSTKPKTTKPKAEDVSDTYHVSLRIGVDGGKLTTVRDIARLSPLPSVTDPFFVYLGVLQTSGKNPEKRAVFVVSSDATPNGEGACHPTKQDCETVELTVGQTVFFDYTAPGGKVTQYQLQLAGIHKTAVHVQAKAAAVFARHSVAGAELLRDAATRGVRAAGGARAYRYLPGAGMLVRARRKHVTARAAAAGTMVPGISLLGRKHQPGIPVWHSPKK